jgi:competence protein ComEA
MISFSKKEQVVILLSVLLIIFSLSYKLLIRDNGIVEKRVEYDNEVDTSEINQIDSDNNILEESLIFVHISGQVYSPGIIELVNGDRVVDAVNLAGGLTKDADIDRINLAKKVEDEEKIYIPKKGEETDIIEGNELSYSSSSSVNNSGKININKCTINELESLPGIGSVIAGRIIDYRSSTPFMSIEDLKNVSGIGDKKFEGIKELITVK